MRKLLQIILLKPILWFANKFSSHPVAERVFESLSDLKEQLEKQPSKKGLVIAFDADFGKAIIFSDQHKGAKMELMTSCFVNRITSRRWIITMSKVFCLSALEIMMSCGRIAGRL